MATKIPIPQPIEPPPRSTGDAQSDYPLLLNWIQRAYQNILQAVQYINEQVKTEDLDPDNLPDPETATIASAQQTANDAYTLAQQADEKADAAQDDADAANTVALAAQSSANNALALVATKQDILVSGTNIKTINGESLLGSGDIVVAGSGGNGYYPGGWA